MQEFLFGHDEVASRVADIQHGETSVPPATDPEPGPTADRDALDAAKHQELGRLGLRYGAATVYAVSGDLYASGDCAHCPEADIRHNIAVLAQRLKRSGIGSVRLSKAYDAQLCHETPMDWIGAWKQYRTYGEPLWRINQDGELLEEAAWGVVPGEGLRPCAADSPYRLTPPAPLTCRACGQVITGRFEINRDPYGANEEPFYEWKCPNWETRTAVGHLWQRHFLDVSLRPPRRTRKDRKRKADPQGEEEISHS